VCLANFWGPSILTKLVVCQLGVCPQCREYVAGAAINYAYLLRYYGKYMKPSAYPMARILQCSTIITSSLFSMASRLSRRKFDNRSRETSRSALAVGQVMAAQGYILPVPDSDSYSDSGWRFAGGTGLEGRDGG
jgi:hypothetical protein